MREARENGQEAHNSPMICGREFNMSEFSDTAKQCGDKVAYAASRASDYVSDKVSAVGNKIKDLQGKDISEIADEAKDYARKNPGHAILISAAAGLVLGFLLRGRR